jgi:beta-phosphoglucomutase-like phosphatase (HAD superfamily)
MATINGAVQGVFWDVDGTLVFTGSCCYDATVKTLINNGLPGVTEEVRNPVCMLCPVESP